MKKQQGITLLEVMVALVVFALAGIALIQTVTQQAGGIGKLEEKVLAGWLADNQLVQLHLLKTWPEKSWSERTVSFAGLEWYLRWRGLNNTASQEQVLEVEVRRNKEESALISLQSYMIRE